MTNHRTPFLTIRAEGALLPTDLLQRVVENDRDLGGLTPESYHLSGEKLNEAINRSWNRLLGAWAAFRVAREKLPEGDPGTSVTREKWLLPLFDELDYGRLQITKAIEIEGKSYAISHGWNEVPIHLVGCGAELDRRSAGVTGAAKASPHSLVQELLNRSPERLWGFVSNGLRMRVLRDNASLTRQAYLEFDLEAMMNGEVYADFVVLWLVCHESRLEPRGMANSEWGMEKAAGEDHSPLATHHSPSECWLEQWSKVAQERGTRALDGLRVGVERAIEALGKGFIAQPANGSLRSALSSGAVSTLDLYRQLLRLVYRLIFLFVAEDRQLLYDPASDAEARKRYADYYSTARLRRMAERVRGSRHADLYAALKLVMEMLGGNGEWKKVNSEWRIANGEEQFATRHSLLALPELGGFLFSRDSIGMLADCELSNAALLDAVRSLAFSQDGRARRGRAVDYKNLGSEELGSIYESLLELHPLVNTDAATFELTAVSGSERKTTGSYYTPSSLIQVLIDSALEPVIAQALDGARRMANGKWENPQEEAYAYSVVSGIGSLEKRHGFGGENLSADQSLSNAGTVRDDIANASGGGLGSSEHRGGLGQNGDEGIQSLSANRAGKSAGVGNSSDSESKSRAESGSAGQAASRNYNNSGEANPIANEKSTAANGEWQIANGKAESGERRMANGEEPLATRQSQFASVPLAIRQQLLAANALLALKVVDPACGSGHFLVAAAHRLARRLATVRTGEGEPAPEATRSALRSVISNCIYGVDINPMSVELCKVSLWMEALEPGKPLSFLDAHIQCGDSLVGVGPRMGDGERIENGELRMEKMANGELGMANRPLATRPQPLTIPDEAFNPAFGDDKATSSALKKRNKRERAGQLGFRFEVTHMTSMDDLARWLAERAEQVDAMPEDDSTQVQAKAKAFDDYHATSEYLKNRFELDLWTAAFFWKMGKAGSGELGMGNSGTGDLDILAPTQGELVRLRNGGEPALSGVEGLDSRLVEGVKEISERLNFFHWELAFPKVFSGENPGFDCVLGNPPWEKINLKDEEYFAQSHPKIANARTKSIRENLISDLKNNYPDDYKEYLETQATHDNLSNYLRASGVFPLTGVSRINLYSVFAELSTKIVSPKGRLGLVIASGIATDDNNKELFEGLIANNRLISVFDFENREAIFPAVHRMYKFCLFCAGGKDVGQKNADFAFYLSRVEQLGMPDRHFTLSHADLQIINPNTKTCPTFRNYYDAEVIKAIYKRIPALCVSEANDKNYGVLKTPFNMSNDSGLFSTKSQILSLGGILGQNGCFNVGKKNYVPLYESKLIHQFNHRYATFNDANEHDASEGNAQELSEQDLQDSSRLVEGRYWLESDLLKDRFPGNWFLAYRMITSPMNERTSIATIIPERPCGHSITIFTEINAIEAILLCATMNSFIFDYVARLKIPGVNFNHWILKQLPILPPSAYTPADIDFIAPRVLELVYTANDLRPFAMDILAETGIEKWNKWFPENKIIANGELRMENGKEHGANSELRMKNGENHSPLAIDHSPSAPLAIGNSLPSPFRWDEVRRAQLRAELDATYARLYGLTRDELRYILDPKEVHGEDFPGETFRVLKEKEIKAYGEYRTRRLVLEAWDNLNAEGRMRNAE